MAVFDGSLARQLEFGELEGSGVAARSGRRGLRLAVPSAVLRGPDKYRVLEHRRRQAQIRARRQLDLLDLELTHA
jgi:hypothetical protein